MASSFSVNDIVINFGQMAKVVEIRSDGLKLHAHGLDMFPGFWIADPAKCKLVESEPILMHKTGLVAFA